MKKIKNWIDGILAPPTLACCRDDSSRICVHSSVGASVGESVGECVGKEVGVAVGLRESSQVPGPAPGNPPRRALVLRLREGIQFRVGVRGARGLGAGLYWAWRYLVL